MTEKKSLLAASSALCALKRTSSTTSVTSHSCSSRRSSSNLRSTRCSCERAATSGEAGPFRDIYAPPHEQLSREPLQEEEDEEEIQTEPAERKNVDGLKLKTTAATAEAMKRIADGSTPGEPQKRQTSRLRQRRKTPAEQIQVKGRVVPLYQRQEPVKSFNSTSKPERHSMELADGGRTSGLAQGRGDAQMKTVRVAVVGAGVVGVSTAVCIAEALPLCSVTLIADRFSPDTTSDGAAGILFAAEFPDVPIATQRRWFRSSFRHLLAIAQSEEAPEAGVTLSSGWQIFKELPETPKPFWWDLVIGFRAMTSGELRRFPGHACGQFFTTLKCECRSYLPWLQRRFRGAGGRVERRRVGSLQELGGDFDLLVNCSGLGSRALLGDMQVEPVRGQVLQVEAPWLQHFIRDGDGKTYIYPGVRSVTIGGTRQAGDWRLGEDQTDTEGIVERCRRLEPSLSRAKVLGCWVGLRPGRRNPRVEKELLQLGGRRVPVVHNYGHGGWGVTLAWGTAVDAVELVRQSLQETPPRSKL
ncbi:D-aspartate oxidase isoform X2 [Oryzias latipes]|nr:D-aspartate oxidase isoform X2 [Oryzias latipes]